MRNEHDLIRELGRGNWIDAVAGEAVVLGYAIHDPELELRGTALGKMVSEIPYNSDQFFRVESEARGLRAVLDKVKQGREMTIFIDNVKMKEGWSWPSRAWEYDLFFVADEFQITMCLPVFDTDEILNLGCKNKIEEQIVALIISQRAGLREERTEEVCQSQKFITTNYFDEGGRVARKTIVHDHQDECTRGFLEKFYFGDFPSALDAWNIILNHTISDRRR